MKPAMGAQVDRLLSLLVLASVLFACCGQDWTPTTATFYTGLGNPACAYGGPSSWISDAYSPVKGAVFTTAVSSTLFKGGGACGACYEVQCVSADANWGGGTKGCTGKTVTVVVTDLCPAAGNERWCGGGKRHFDMAKSAWLQIGKTATLGQLDAQFRRVPCRPTSGGRQLNLAAKLGARPNSYWRSFILYYGCGDGTFKGLQVSDDGGGSWTSCSRSWGVNFACQGALNSGSPLSFQITSGSGETVTVIDALGSGWQYDNSIQDLKTNFKSCGGQTGGGSSGNRVDRTKRPRKPAPRRRSSNPPGGHCKGGRIAFGKRRGQRCSRARTATH